MCLPSNEEGGRLVAKGKAGKKLSDFLPRRDFPSIKFFRQIFIIPKISPHPSLQKRGEFFITFPSPSQGEGGGGVHSLIG
jgi:hypothetical protein